MMYFMRIDLDIYSNENKTGLKPVEEEVGFF